MILFRKKIGKIKGLSKGEANKIADALSYDKKAIIKPQWYNAYGYNMTIYKKSEYDS